MSAHCHPPTLEAHFGQVAAALASGVKPSVAVLAGLAAKTHLALRGLDAVVHQGDAARLARTASRLARRLAATQSGSGGAVRTTALAHRVLQLGIEMGQRLEPLAIAAVVRSAMNGGAEVSSFAAVSDGPDHARVSLFTQLALVTAIARSRLS